MRVSRAGLTPLKGTRHHSRDHVDLTLDGPRGDRVFCLVDRAAGRVLRTVEHPALHVSTVSWHAGVLRAELPDGVVEGVPGAGERVALDYWGRTASLELVTGPWAAAYSRFLGRDVELARAAGPGEVVFAGSVSLVTAASLEDLARRLGAPVAEAAFRATFTVDTPGAPAFVEEGWVGRRLRLGDAEVEVRSPLPRCAVVDLDPVTGMRRAPVLRTLAGYRLAAGEVPFGVDAAVTRAGRVHVGSPVALVGPGDERS